MAERYWAMMSNKKYSLIYLGFHHHLNVEIERWIDIVLAVISTGALGALFIFDGYQMVWTVILAIAQIITAARPYMPFRNRIIQLDKGIFLLNILYNEMESKWNMIASGELNDSEINEVYYDFIQRWDKVDSEILKEDSLPRYIRYEREAEREKNKYFDVMFGGKVNE